MTIKIVVKKIYHFKGNIDIYYLNNKYYIDENSGNIYYQKYISSFYQKIESTLTERIKVFLNTNKGILTLNLQEINKSIDSIIDKLNIYPYKNSIKIISQNKSGNAVILIKNKKNNLNITIIFENGKLMDIIYNKYKSKYYDFSFIDSMYKYNGEFDCKPKE